MLLRSNFTSFSHYFLYIFLTSEVKLQIHLLNVVVQFIDLLTLSTLICRGTDISKCFSESLGIRDNESRLYVDSQFLIQVSSYVLHVRATNYHLIAETMVNIEVLDANDCPPRFSETNYTVFVQVSKICL